MMAGQIGWFLSTSVPRVALRRVLFASYADRDVCSMTLREALKSPFLTAIRVAHGRLTETTGGCALWTQRDWVRSLIARS